MTERLDPGSPPVGWPESDGAGAGDGGLLHGERPESGTSTHGRRRLPHTRLAQLARLAGSLSLGPVWRARMLFAGKAFIVTSLLAATGLLIVRARRDRVEQPRHSVDLAVWQVAERPAWATLADVAQLRDTSGLVGRALPLYSRDAVELARLALEETPRARRVVALRRLPPDSIEVLLEMRRPVAAVAVPGGRFVEVDQEGVVLGPPQVERPVREGVALRVVTGGAEPFPAPGAVCAADVRCGLELCQQLDGYRGGLGARILRAFDEVDVSNHDGRMDAAASALLLRAAAPAAGRKRPVACVVEWGRPGTRHGEPPFFAKAGRLERAISVFGDFDGVARVRVAFEFLSILPVDGPDGAWLPALAEQSRAR